MAIGDSFGLAWMGFVWIAIIVAVWVAIIVVILLGLRWLVRTYFRTRDEAERAKLPGGPADPALLALRERFARGEIDADEFEQRRRVLGG